jgi:pimeloyl-ACP methyl ester carboxylesterase
VFVRDLEACGFHEDSQPRTLWICAYDWRRDIGAAAERLANVVDEAADQHRSSASITLVAHSMGGLVGRSYLESGRFDRRPGFQAVHDLIMLATPHRGAPLALTAALGRERRLFLDQEQVLRLVSDARYPSVYQMLPPRGEPFAWDVQPDARFAPLDVYNPEITSRLGLVPDNLEAAGAFHGTLDISKRPPHVRYFCFVGTRQTTISAVTVLQEAAGFRVEKIEPDDAGDGTVPIQSGTMTGVQSRAVGGEHGTIYKNDELRVMLAGLLGAPGALEAKPTGIEVVVRDRVVRPAGLVRLTLSFAIPQAAVEGELRFERAEFDPSYATATFSAADAYPIRYAGPAVEKVGVTFRAPSSGLYRVVYYASPPASTAPAIPAGADELFVQAS